MIKFQAENGETLIARDEVQAAAMKNGGLVEVGEVENAVEATPIEEATAEVIAEAEIAEEVAPTTTKKGK
jgi:hypothetical protein